MVHPWALGPHRLFGLSSCNGFLMSFLRAWSRVLDRPVRIIMIIALQELMPAFPLLCVHQRRLCAQNLVCRDGRHCASKKRIPGLLHGGILRRHICLVAH